MKDMHSHLLAVSLIGAAALSADNTPVAADLRGYNAAEILLAVGVGGISFTGTNKIEFKLTHSDDDISYEPVDVGDVLGLEAVGAGGIVKSLTSAHAEAAVYRLGYKGGRRYLKLLADFGGTHGAGTPITAILLKGHGSDRPEVNQA